MLDYINLAPIPKALTLFIQSTLRGESCAWPTTVAEAEISALDEHGVIPLLFARSRWPVLKDHAVHEAALEMARLADLRTVLAALGPVKPLILKGTALAYSLYTAPEHRPRGDTDLLIERGGLETASEILTGLGFASSPSSGDELGMRQRSFWRTDALGIEHTYDVHWAISNHAVFADVLRYPELRDRAVSLPRIGMAARGLSLVDALIVACVHRVAHHHASERLIWLYDIHLLRSAMTTAEHEAFWQLARQRQVLAVCSESVRAAVEWFGPSGDEARLPASSRPEVSGAFLDRTRRRGSFLIADVAALSTWIARWRRVMDLALPPRAYMANQFGTSNRFLLPLLYAFRAARGLTRLFRRVA